MAKRNARSPTVCTIAKLKNESTAWRTAIVERWNPFAKIRQDLYGFIDILAVHSKHGFLAIQACNISDIYKRRQKCVDKDHIKNLRSWLEAGGRFEIWGWHKPNHRYEVKILVVDLAYLDSLEEQDATAEPIQQD